MHASVRSRFPSIFKEHTLPDASRGPCHDSSAAALKDMESNNPFVVEEGLPHGKPAALPQPLQPRPFLQHVLKKVVDRRAVQRDCHSPPLSARDSKQYNTVDNRRAAEVLAYEDPEWIATVKSRRPDLPSIVAERQRKEAKIKQEEQAAAPVILSPLESMVVRLDRAEVELVVALPPQPPPPQPHRRASFRRVNDNASNN